MILCHKCSGLLAHEEKENVKDLRQCSCMSGYVRGFEPSLTREQAIEQQIKTRSQFVALYIRQGRSQSEIDAEQAIVNNLKKLLERS